MRSSCPSIQPDKFLLTSLDQGKPQSFNWLFLKENYRSITVEGQLSAPDNEEVTLTFSKTKNKSFIEKDMRLEIIVSVFPNSYKTEDKSQKDLYSRLRATAKEYAIVDYRNGS